MTGSDGRTPVVRLAPAKLNLTLAVLGTRPDGFHDLHSVMVPLGFGDRLSLARAAGAVDQLHVVDAAGRSQPANGFDSVLVGIREARRAVGRAAEAFPLAARLEKRIPVAAGLAGGSSDAAAALDGALEAWGADADLPAHARATASAAAGSDVPFFLAGGPALVEGRGDRVTPLNPLAGDPPGVLIVTPALELSTPAAFAAFDGDPAAAPANRGSTLLSSQHLAAELGPGHAPMRAADLVRRAGVLAVANDLASAADVLAPGLRQVRRALMRLLGVPIGLSGSGPTLWALYPSLDGAEAAAWSVREELARGRIEILGNGAPFIEPTTIDSGLGRSPG